MKISQLDPIYIKLVVKTSLATVFGGLAVPIHIWPAAAIFAVCGAGVAPLHTDTFVVHMAMLSCAANLTPHSPMFRAIIVAMLSILVTACGIKPRAPTENALVQRGYSAMDQWLDATAKKSMRRAGITGLSVAVTDADGVVLQRHYGFADKANAVPVSNETRFRAGSVSKPFTSIAVHQLAEQGLLDRDAPLQTIIPDFSIRSRHGGVDQITLRNILSHHAGFPSDADVV